MESKPARQKRGRQPMKSDFTRVELNSDRELQDIHRFALPRYKRTLTPKQYERLATEIRIAAKAVA
jgi:hypothetical protein